MVKKLRVWSGILFLSVAIMFAFAGLAKADSGVLGASPDANASSAGKIAAAYSSEAISLETFVVQSLKSYFVPDQVDARFASAIPNQPNRDITPLLDLARTHYNEFSAESQAFLDMFLKRPTDLDYGYPWGDTPFYLPPASVKTYPSGNFLFHYVDSATPDTAGHVHQTTLVFVQKIAAAFDAVVAKSITGDGYPFPPNDPGGAAYGGDTKFDVYIMNTGAYSVYGYVSRENPPGGDGNAYSSFMVLDNGFTEFAHGAPNAVTAEQAMQVTVAHEFHHAIQNGVNGLANSWYKECTATWNEYNVYPDIKDNLQYLNGGNGFFTRPWKSLDTADSNWYKTWLWNEFLTITYGAGTVKKVWDNLNPSGSDNAVTALDTFIAGKGSTLLKDFRTWAAKNYSKLGFYADAAIYDAMKFDINVDYNGGNPYTVDYTAGNTSKSATVTFMHHLAAQYAQVVPGATLTKPTTLSIQVEGPLGKDVSAIVIAKNKNGTYTEYPIDMVDKDGKKQGSCGVSGFCTGNITEVAIALVNASKVPADDNQTMSFTASLAKAITFVIDDTGSMGSSIAGAKAAADAVLDANKAAKADGTATDTYFYTLFSFKDGAGTLRGQTADEDVMKGLVAALYADGGWGLQESSLTTIRQATRAEEGADIFMMTDAPSNSYGVDSTNADWGEVLETIYDLVSTNCRLHVIYFSSSSYRTGADLARDNNGNPITLPEDGVVSLGYYGAAGADGYARAATESGGLFFADISGYDSATATKIAEIILRISGSAGTFAFVDGTRTDTSPATTNYTIPVDATVSDLQITLNGNPGSAVTMTVNNQAGDTLTTDSGVVSIITTSGTTCYLISGAKVTSGNWTAVVSGLGSYRVIATGSTSNPMTYTGDNAVGKGGTLHMSAIFQKAVSGVTFTLTNLDGSVYKPVTLTTSDGGRNYAGTFIMKDLGSYRFLASKTAGTFQRTSSQKIIVGSVSVTASLAVNKKPNDTFTHAFVIKNLSIDTATTDTFTIYVTSSLGWSDISKDNTLIGLKGGASYNLVINGTVPSAAVSGSIDTLSVSAVSQANPLISASAQTETRYAVIIKPTGDINGDSTINITDVILCLRQAIGLDALNPALADMNGDGLVNITDVILILRKAIGLDPRLRNVVIK